jgi:hypothetical protein
MNMLSRSRFAPWLAVSLAWFATSSLSAQPTPQTRQVSVVYELAPIGLAHGETLRYSWANLTEPGDGKRILEPLRISVRLFAADGSVVAQDVAEAVGGGRFQMFDFKRGQLDRPGEPGNGRLGLRLEVTLLGHTKYNDIVLKRGVTHLFDDAVEIFDDVSGATTVHVGGGMNELSLDDTPGNPNLDADGFQIISAGKDHLLGIAPGQSLRLSASNPLSRGEVGRTFKPLFAFLVADVDGRVLAQSAAITLDSGQAHSFHVTYQELAVNASATGRLQVRIELRRFFPGIASRVSQGSRDAAPASLELVDTASGRTVLFTSQKPKEIVVVGSRIDP